MRSGEVFLAPLLSTWEKGLGDEGKRFVSQSAPEQRSLFTEAIDAGADGLCFKEASIVQLTEAVCTRDRQGRYQDPAIATLLEPITTAW